MGWTSTYFLGAAGVFGFGFFALYFGLFYFFIKKFDIKTPGREDDDEQVVNTKADVSELAQQYINALGGDRNMVNIDACITRLRLTV